MALRRVSIPSPNYSSRGAAAVTTIVLHTAEGALSYQSLGNYFANPAAQVSSHVGIDDTPGTVGEYVPRSGKAWTAADANPWSIQAELCAFAAWDSPTWNSHPDMLANTAAWIAEEAAHFDIPLVRLSPAQAQNPAVRGVCQHADLGAMGGGHWDCGPAFPINDVLAAAADARPAPLPEELAPVILIRKASTGEVSVLFDNGTRFYINDTTTLKGLQEGADLKTATVADAWYNQMPRADGSSR
jgi:hypothetical protein